MVNESGKRARAFLFGMFSASHHRISNRLVEMHGQEMRARHEVVVQDTRGLADTGGHIMIHWLARTLRRLLRSGAMSEAWLLQQAQGELDEFHGVTWIWPVQAGARGDSQARLTKKEEASEGPAVSLGQLRGRVV